MLLAGIASLTDTKLHGELRGSLNSTDSKSESGPTGRQIPAVLARREGDPQLLSSEVRDSRFVGFPMTSRGFWVEQTVSEYSGPLPVFGNALMYHREAACWLQM